MLLAIGLALILPRPLTRWPKSDVAHQQRWGMICSPYHFQEEFTAVLRPVQQGPRSQMRIITPHAARLGKWRSFNDAQAADLVMDCRNARKQLPPKFVMVPTYCWLTASYGIHRMEKYDRAS